MFKLVSVLVRCKYCKINLNFQFVFLALVAFALAVPAPEPQVFGAYSHPVYSHLGHSGVYTHSGYASPYVGHYFY